MCIRDSLCSSGSSSTQPHKVFFSWSLANRSTVSSSKFSAEAIKSITWESSVPLSLIHIFPALGQAPIHCGRGDSSDPAVGSKAVEDAVRSIAQPAAFPDFPVGRLRSDKIAKCSHDISVLYADIASILPDIL